MANAVFIQNPSSAYDDQPGVCYHFPKMYLKRVEACIGDWVLFYEGKKGALGYTAVQKVASVTPDPDREGHYYAWLELDTLWQFEQIVPRIRPDGLACESRLRGRDGRAMSGGYAVSAVRAVSLAEFTDILTAGLAEIDDVLALPREDRPPDLPVPGFGEAAQAAFDYPGLSDIRRAVLSSRLARDGSFARQVKRAYQGRCAISGMDLRNAGGRLEVQAAHIRPVKDGGPDVVANGLALSGTLHWMFDRGLISVGANFEILVSDNKVPADVKGRLISPTGRLHLPLSRRDWPHPEYLRYHRENVYGCAA